MAKDFFVHRVSSSLLGPVDPSFRALSGRLKFTVRRHKFNKYYPPFVPPGLVNNVFVRRLINKLSSFADSRRNSTNRVGRDQAGFVPGGRLNRACCNHETRFLVLTGRLVSHSLVD